MSGYLVGGKRYVSIGTSTAAHDFWFMGHVRRAGLDRITPGPGESPEEYAKRLLMEVLASGHTLQLLGALVIPEGTDPLTWTPQMAESTAAALGSVSDPKDKATLEVLVVELLLCFFSLERAFLKSFDDFSDPVTKSAPPPSLGESGQTSSESLPGGTGLGHA